MTTKLYQIMPPEKHCLSSKNLLFIIGSYVPDSDRRATADNS